MGAERWDHPAAGDGQIGDAARLARAARLNVEAALRSGHPPATIVLTGPGRLDDTTVDRPILVERRYADAAPDNAMLLFLLLRYAERDERHDPDRHRSIRLSLVAAGLVAVFVAISAGTRHLSLTGALVLLLVVAVALAIPTVMVDARIAREFAERVDYQAGYRYGQGAEEAFTAELTYRREHDPGRLPRAPFGIFSTGLSEQRRRTIIGAGERAALEDAA